MSDRNATGQRVLQPRILGAPARLCERHRRRRRDDLSGRPDRLGCGRDASPMASPARSARRFTNIVTLLAEAGAEPQHLVRLTWFVTDLRAYREQPVDDRRGVSARHRPALSHHVGHWRVATGRASGAGGNRGNRRAAAMATAACRNLTPKLSSPEIIAPARTAPPGQFVHREIHMKARLFAAATALGILGASAAAQAQIKIGAILSISGPGAAMGVGYKGAFDFFPQRDRRPEGGIHHPRRRDRCQHRRSPSRRR